MKRKPNKFLLLFIACLFFLSCENNVVPVVSNSTGSSSKGLLPPENVTAVGGKKKITLIWSPSSNATHYSIYAAPTQFDKFVKIGESTTTTYTYNVGAGLTRYFKVVAENERTNKSSDDSLIAKGFTLAQPTITSIDSYMDGNDSINIVYWYMSNLEDYQDYVQYEIRCYNGNNLVREVFVDGKDLSDTNYQFENLPQNKTVQFEIEAFLSNEQSVSEKSTRLDTVTAARQTPDPVTGLKASYGIASDKIELSFELPDYSYVKKDNEIKEHALCFQIFRREQREGSTDADWGTALVNRLYYDGQSSIKPDEKNYIPGNICKYEDKDLTAGKKYEYKIQSYVQGVDTEITSPTHSVATTMGWTCGLPLLMTDEFEYEKDDSGEKISAWLDFKASWNNFGNENEYKFLLESTRTKKGLPTKITYSLFSTTKDIDDYKKHFDLLNDLGTYKFKLYVVKAEGATETAECAAKALVSKEASDEILVSILKSLPELKIFEKDDGYKDKVILCWDDEQSNGGPATSYNLLRYLVDSNGIKTDDPEREFTNVTSGLTATDGKFTYTDNTDIESGKRYRYTLIAKALEDPSDLTSELDVPSTPIIAETLGTPNPVFDNNNPKHDKIIITWNKVLKADDDNYTVKLKDGTNEISPDKIEIKKNSDNTFTCEIQKPAGYNDAGISGKKWTAYVTAKSKNNDGTEKDTTQNSGLDVRTLGPLGITPTATVSADKEKITVTWKKIPGAKRYAIKRTRYEVTDTSFTSPIENGTDVYYVTANGGISDSLDSASTTILLNNNDNTFTLTDTCKQLEKAEGASPLAINQDRLSWGYPYRYTIIPLENSSLEIDDTGTISLPENQKLEYTNIDVATATGSCIGYGHNVRATKAEDPYAITITCDAPYEITQDDVNQLKLWYKQKNGSWALYDDEDPAINGNKLTFNFEPTDLKLPRTGTYWFAVGYKTTKPNPSYLGYKTPDQDYSSTEDLNKGYTYSLELTAKPCKTNGVLGFEEEFEWAPWDYKERAIGPESNIEFCLFNNDFVVVTSSDDGWRTIAEIDENGNVTPYEEFNYSNEDKEKYKVEKYNVKFKVKTNTSVRIAPKDYNDEAPDPNKWHNGLLKVQRDYKHYAKLKCDRETKDGNKVKLSWADKDNAKGDLLVYGYRNFTNAEIVRSALYLFAYGFYLNDGNPSNLEFVTGDSRKKYGGKGTLKAAVGLGNAEFTERSGATSQLGAGKYKQYYTYTNYNDSLKTPSGNYVVSPLTISCNKYSCGISGNSDNYIYKFRDTHDITLKPTDSNCGIPLGATLNFYCPDKNTLTIKLQRDGETTSSQVISTTNENTRKIWFPMQIHSDKAYYFNSTTYDWWGE